MKRDCEVLVIGGGVIGSAAAAHLARLGRTVVLADADTPDADASSGSLAWLNASSASDNDYARLRVASLRLWKELAAEPGCPVRLEGALVWSETGDAEAEADWLASLDWPARAIDPAEVAKIAPGLAPRSGPTLFAPDEGAADPRRIVAWLRRRATDAGARLVKTRVAALDVGAAGVVGAVLATGEKISASGVVLAAGAAGPDLLRPLGAPPPLRDAPGALAITSPAEIVTRAVVASPDLDYWQDDDGRFLIGTGVAAEMDDGASGPADAALAALRGLAPGIGSVAVEAIRIRNRPIPLDGFPALGAPDGVGGLFAAVTHSGMTLAPIIAAVAAAALGGDAPPADIRRYRIDRDFTRMDERRRA